MDKEKTSNTIEKQVKKARGQVKKGKHVWLSV